MIKNTSLFLSLLLIVLGGNAQIITRVAGNGVVGYSGNGGPALMAELNRPNGGCSTQDDKVMDLSKQPNGLYFYRVLKGDGSVLSSGR